MGRGTLKVLLFILILLRNKGNIKSQLRLKPNLYLNFKSTDRLYLCCLYVIYFSIFHFCDYKNKSYHPHHFATKRIKSKNRNIPTSVHLIQYGKHLSADRRLKFWVHIPLSNEYLFFWLKIPHTTVQLVYAILGPLVCQFGIKCHSCIKISLSFMISLLFDLLHNSLCLFVHPSSPFYPSLFHILCYLWPYLYLDLLKILKI